MANIVISRCLWCGLPIEQPLTGRPRRYCSERCRTRARRERQKRAWSLIGRPQHELVTGAAPEAILSQALTDLRTTARALAATAPYLSPSFAVRAEATAECVLDVVKREWGDVL